MIKGIRQLLGIKEKSSKVSLATIRQVLDEGSRRPFTVEEVTLINHLVKCQISQRRKSHEGGLANVLHLSVLKSW